MPGLAMKIRALHTFTAKLPLLQNDDTYPHPTTGRNTQQSMGAGVYVATLFALQGFIGHYRSLDPSTKVVVTGRIQTGSYTNKDGQKVYTTVVVTDEHEFAESKNCAGANESAGRTAGQQAEGGDTYDSGFEDIPEGFSDNLPFT